MFVFRSTNSTLSFTKIQPVEPILLFQTIIYCVINIIWKMSKSQSLVISVASMIKCWSEYKDITIFAISYKEIFLKCIHSFIIL